MSEKDGLLTTKSTMSTKKNSLCPSWPLWLNPALFFGASLPAPASCFQKPSQSRRKSSHAPHFPAENRGSRSAGESLKLCQNVAKRYQTSLKSLKFEDSRPSPTPPAATGFRRLAG